MHRIRRNDLASGLPHHPPLPEHEADGQHDGDEHDSDAALLRCEVMGFRAEQPPKPIPRDEGGRHQDEGRLPERGQILHRGMAEGVILIRRARGIEDRGQSAQRHQQVE